MAIEKEYVSCPLCGESNYSSLFLGRDRLYKRRGRFWVVECNVCHMKYLNPRPTNKSMRFYYPDDYYAYEREGEKQHKAVRKFRWFIREFFLRCYLRRLDRKGCKYTAIKDVLLPFVELTLEWYFGIGKLINKKEQKLLDVGCGSGRYLRRVRELGWHVYGVDISKSACEVAKKDALTIFCGELGKAAFPNNYFDIVQIHHVLEHVMDPVALLKEVNRVLKSNGTLIVTVPNGDSIARSMFGRFWSGFDVPRHVLTFTPFTLQRMLEHTGYRVERTRTLAKPLFSTFVRSLGYVIDELLGDIDRRRDTAAEKSMGYRVSNSKALSFFIYPVSFAICCFGLGEEVKIVAVKKVTG